MLQDPAVGASPEASGGFGGSRSLRATGHNRARSRCAKSFPKCS